MSEVSTLRICYVAGTLGQGGAERQLFYALRALRQVGASARVLCLDRGAFWEEPIQRLGVPVTWVGQYKSRLKRLWRILRELKREPADVLQSSHFYTNAYACAAARALNRTGIGTLRSNGAFDLSESGPLRGFISLRLPRVLAANSRCAIRHAISKGVNASRLYFLPNVVDTDKFKPSPQPNSKPVTLLAVGRLTKEKRFDRFLSILARLRQGCQLDVRGLIVGPTRPDQDLKPQLEAQAASLGLFPDGVQFRGSIADMPAVYQEADICVLTSDFEGTPNVVLEAMAAGLPVVATNVGGVPEIVRDGETGFLLQPDDLEGQVGKLSELIRNPQQRADLGRHARDFVEEHHSVHVLPAHLRGLYRLALGTDGTVAQGARPAAQQTPFAFGKRWI